MPREGVTLQEDFQVLQVSGWVVDTLSWAGLASRWQVPRGNDGLRPCASHTPHAYDPATASTCFSADEEQGEGEGCNLMASPQVQR